MTNVLNPKVALFFLAFLPQFIDSDGPSKALAFVFLGLIFDFNGTLWNVLVAWLSGRAASSIMNSAPIHRWIDRTIGVLLICVGIRLAIVQRG